MADHLATKDRNSPAENKGNQNLSSSGKEGSDNNETTYELTSEQIKEVKNLLKKADEENNGVVCDRDEVKYLTYLERDCTPEQRQEAIAELPEHLEKKAEYLKEYIYEVETHFLVNGEINEKGKELIEEYKDMTGGERKEAAKTLRTLIRERVQEKKSYLELLQESPHFSENGQMTPKAQELFELYQQSGGSEKAHHKRKLLEMVRQYEGVEKECERLYKSANTLYKNGKFSEGEVVLGIIIELCDEYSSSPRMQVLRGWNERDLANMQDHTEKQKEINILIGKRDFQKKEKNTNRALELSKEVFEKTTHFFKKTVNRHRIVVDRTEDDQRENRYLQDLYQEAWSEHSAFVAAKNKQDQQVEEKEELNKRVQQDMLSREGTSFAAKMGSLEEELTVEEEQRTNKDRVYDEDPNANEDIKDITNTDLEKDDGREVVMDFHNNVDERAERITLLDINTGVAKDGRVITNEKELQNMVDETAQHYVDSFTEREKAAGVISNEVLERYREGMLKKTETGQYSQQFKKDARDETTAEIIEFGRRFRQTQADFAQDLVETGQESAEEQGDEVDFAEEVIKQRQQQRKAA